MELRKNLDFLKNNKNMTYQKFQKYDISKVTVVINGKYIASNV